MCVTKTQREETNEEIQKLDSTPPEIYSTVVCGFMCKASVIFFFLTFFIHESVFFNEVCTYLPHETSGCVCLCFV